MPDAWVTASGARTPSSGPALSDESGAFVLAGLLEGTHELSASTNIGQGRLANVATNSTNVVIPVGTYGAISGTVEESDGTQSQEFTLLYRETTEHGMHSANGTAGTWSLPWLPAGSYRVSAMGARGCGWADTRLDPRGDVRVKIRLNHIGDVCSKLWHF